jgi:hypothetical protein
MGRIEQAREILESLGMPRAQRNARSALTLLALAQIGPRTPWRRAKAPRLRIWDIMGFIRDKYGKDYAANSRETIRRQSVHQFEQARLIDRNPDDPARPTNSGQTVYALTARAREILRAYGTKQFSPAVARFLDEVGGLEEAYRGEGAPPRVPLHIPGGKTIELSPGEHNELQAAVIQELGPRFASGATVLYLGDTAKKHVVYQRDELASLGVPITRHRKLPDIVLYHNDASWLYLIEAVTSHGPVSPKRYFELEQMVADCSVARIYISAFPDADTFRKYAAEIAWETEVWIADQPEHMIHFNGPKFLQP